MHILLLEDDPALRFALTEVLEDGKHMVHVAANIAEAAKLIEIERFDLLLLDLMIGDDLSTQIADLAGYRLPQAEIIYLTGSNRFPNGELFELSRNASWVLRKPVDFFELKAMVAHTRQHPADKGTASALPFAYQEACS
ncbi:MAG: response regulator [Pseudomonadota bacterium]